MTAQTAGPARTSNGCDPGFHPSFPNREGPMPREILSAPEYFHYAESSLFGGLRHISIEEGVLTCTACQGCEGQGVNSVRPPRQFWATLWNTLEELEAWDWSGYYGNLTVMDGVSWALDIDWRGRMLEASG